MDSLNIHTIIDGCRANNQAARELLFQQVFEFALPVARRYARSDAEARLQVEYLYVEILEQLPQYDGRQINFKSWVKQLLLKDCIDQLKARFNAREEDQSDLSPDWYYLYRIRKLSPLQQALLNLHDLEGYSLKEIATIFSLEPGNCERTYHQAVTAVTAPLPGLASPLTPLSSHADKAVVADSWTRIEQEVKERFYGEIQESSAISSVEGEVISERSWQGWAVLIGLVSGCLILFSALHLIAPLRIKAEPSPVNYILLPHKK